MELGRFREIRKTSRVSPSYLQCNGEGIYFLAVYFSSAFVCVCPRPKYFHIAPKLGRINNTSSPS